MSTEEGQAALRRVLLAFSAHQPQVIHQFCCFPWPACCFDSLLRWAHKASIHLQVGYCQGMNYLAAMLLLALERSEEDSFWLLVSLIDDGGECLLI
jgi:hypothetical protein